MSQTKDESNLLVLALESYNRDKETILDDWFDTLRIASISPGNKNATECLECAELFREKLEKIGLRAKLVPTSGNPVVYGEYKINDNYETILIYGHYDVQPVEERNWKTPPFSPQIIDGRVYARGAHDDKGQVYYVLGAIGALIRDNKLGYNVKIIIDGEEESGSKNTSDIFTSLKDDLVSDYLLVYDSSTTGKDEGCIELSLRGICSFKIQLTGAKTGFHSGEYGGILRNPAMELVKLLSTLQSGDGRVSVSGFYDGVEELEALPYDKILSYDAEKCLKNTGAYPTGGEQYIDNPRVRAGFRPTLDILYLSSGATFEKDVSNSIPSTATAIISCRLVGKQEPDRIFEAIKTHLEINNKSGMKLSVEKRGDGVPAYRIAEDSLGVVKAEEILSLICSKVNHNYSGSSIPFIKNLARFIKNEPVLVGFGLEEDNIHADNESFALEQFKKGFLFTYLYFAK